MSAAPERYERDVIERLRHFESEGKGKVLELCELDFDGRKLPLVAFTTGDTALVTARHHVYEAFGTDETIYSMIEDGIEGITYVPVVDAQNYDKAQIRIENWFRDHPENANLFVLDMLRELTNAENGWSEYSYGEEDAPEQIKRIGELAKTSGIVFDLHNARENYFFVTEPTGDEGVRSSLEEGFVQQLSTRGYGIKEHPMSSGLPFLKEGFLYPNGKGILGYSGRNGVLNYGVEIPAVYFDGHGAVQLSDTGSLVDANKGIINSAVELLR